MCRLVSDRTERVPEIRNTPGHAQYGFRSPGRQKAQSKSHFALGGVSQLAAQISTFPAKKSAFARLEPPFVAQFVKNSVSAIILTAVSKEASCLFRKYSSLSLGGVLEWRAPCPMAPKERFKYYKTYHSYTLAYSPLSFEVLLQIRYDIIY